ncbi:MAG: hypothetical protein JNJ58_11230 [Chitinophagaceae bacterium]|nr:hypothetical protein [Chitinophagaceae bacterium]
MALLAIKLWPEWRKNMHPNPEVQSEKTHHTETGPTRNDAPSNGKQQNDAPSNGKQLEATKTLPSQRGPGDEQAIPSEAYQVRDYVDQHHRPPAEYEGGRVFQNRERRLPIEDERHRRIRYQEWDLKPHRAGRNRGAERLVTGSDGRDWYTDDHYRSFRQLKE